MSAPVSERFFSLGIPYSRWTCEKGQNMCPAILHLNVPYLLGSRFEESCLPKSRREQRCRLVFPEEAKKKSRTMVCRTCVLQAD